MPDEISFSNPPRMGPPAHLNLQSDQKYDEANDPERTPRTPRTRDDEKEEDRKRVLVETALKQFKLADSFEREQRQRELEDLKFDRALPEDQWPEHIMKARSSGEKNGQYVPDRPCLTIPKLDQPVQQVIDEARRARLGVQIKPKGSGADADGAWVRQGLYRSMEMRCRANLARLWALDRAVKCGRGGYRILKQYVGKKSFDQEIVIERILNQHSMYLDPFAQKPDWSDGEFAFLTSDIPLTEFKRLWKDASIGLMSSGELEALGDAVPGWVGGEEDSRTVRVAEYFYVEHTNRGLFDVRGIGVLWQDELPTDMQGWAAQIMASDGDPTKDARIAQYRAVDERIVKWAVITANEVLDEEEWDGEYIPIIPVIGKEYNVNGDRCFKGVISNSKDSQRMFNYMSSGAAEASGLLSRAPWVMAEGQDEGYKAMWNDPTPYRYLVYKPTTFEGELVPAPQRNFGTVDLAAFAQLRQDADMDIQATTARFNNSLGRQNSPNQSGKLAQQLIQQGESSTSTYLENLAQISMTHEARVVLDLFKKIYDSQGRIERVIGDEDGDEKTVMLNAPFYHTPQGPVPVTPEQQQPPQGLMQRFARTILPGQAKPPQPKDIKHYDLSKGEYDVVIDIGRSFATQRDETNYILNMLLEADPQIAGRISDILVSSLNTPIAKKLEERLKPPDVKDDKDQQGPSPEEIQQLLTQHKALVEQNQQLQHAIETKQAEAEAKSQASIQIAQINAAASIERAKIAAASQGAVAAAKIDSEEAMRLIEIEADRAGLQGEQRHDFIQSRLAEDHDHALADKEAATRVAEAAAAPPPANGGAA